MLRFARKLRKGSRLADWLRAILALFALIFCVGSAQAIGPVVRTEAGLVRGSGADVVVFKGIPFAAAPVGPLRWKAPQPAVPWEGTREATEFCASCPQPVVFSDAAYSKQSEDCLALNIWTPARTAKDKLPVMVWIHGGGFAIGSSAQRIYDGEALARQGVVLVTVNYRLGVFGFLAHPELSRESPQGVSGNYGLLDQIAALKWVHRNIANFGGDSRRVTIFGESAGGTSVLTLVVSPLAKGLFQRAIAQSAAFVFTPIRHLRESWYGYRPAEAAGAELGDLATLRGLTVPELLDMQRRRAPNPHPFVETGRGAYRPIVDGWVVPDDPSELYEQGRFNRVPLIAGVNADEGALFVGFLIAPAKNVEGYRAWLKTCFGEEAGVIFEQYPANEASEVLNATRRVVTDFMFATPTLSTVRAVESRAPVYLYRFTRVNASGKATKMGAYHGVEVAYVFGNLKSPAFPFKDADIIDDIDLAVSKAMMAAWVQFAKTGAPNGSGLPKWPRYSTTTEQCMEFADTPRATQLPESRRIDVCYSVFKQLRASRLKPIER